MAQAADRTKIFRDTSPKCSPIRKGLPALFGCLAKNFLARSTTWNGTVLPWIDVTIRKRICFFQGSGYMGVVYPFAGTYENLLFSPSPHLSPVSLTGWERTDPLPISFFPFSQRVRMPSSVLRALFLSTGNHRIHKGGVSSCPCGRLPTYPSEPQKRSFHYVFKRGHPVQGAQC